MPSTFEKVDDNTLVEVKLETKTEEVRREWKVSELKAKIAYLQSILVEMEKVGINTK